MGGDSTPGNPVQGALIALERNPQLQIIFVGPQREVEAEVTKYNIPTERYEIIHASQVVTMADSPVKALRKKKDSSIAVALTLHRMGKVQAVVSAGNTGAQVAASMVKLERIEGVLRPVIGSMLPTVGSPCMLLDVGANTDCMGVHLFQFGVMGAIFVEAMLGVKNPRVGLLSIGAERTKGNEVSLFAHFLFSKSHLNFVGNIEGSDLLAGKADVAVCDGFVGNLLLKFAESFPRFLVKSLMTEKDKESAEKLANFFQSSLNPELYGGVPILGVNGISVVCHGVSSPLAFANGIRVASEMAEKGINLLIAERLTEIHRFYEMNKYFLNLRKSWENRDKTYWNPKRFFKWFDSNQIKSKKQRT
jgi:glycerol-3-phosphate acyltransferase PlsX